MLIISSDVARGRRLFSFVAHQPPPLPTACALPASCSLLLRPVIISISHAAARGMLLGGRPGAGGAAERGSEDPPSASILGARPDGSWAAGWRLRAALLAPPHADDRMLRSRRSAPAPAPPPPLCLLRGGCAWLLRTS